MFNLSLTACSFYLRKTYSKGNTQILSLNAPAEIEGKENTIYCFKDMADMFVSFFEEYTKLVKDDVKKQSFRCEFERSNCFENDDFKMIYVKIHSGNYGSSSDIIDGDTQKVQYQKKTSDIDVRPFYLMVVFPKDNEQAIVQKGMFVFQNVGPFGIKTITTHLMQNFFSEEFGITLRCRTIAPDLFVRKVIRRDNIKKLLMVKNIKSADISDNINMGYGSEVREISNLRFSESAWEKIMNKIRYVAGGRYNLFEFEQVEYDNLKVVVDIGGRTRKINLHCLDNLSIIEGIPDEIRMADGHPNLEKLIDYMKQVVAEYLDEMVLHIE